MTMLAENLSMPQRAHPYGRTSDPKQQKGDGHRRQEDFAEQICQEEGWCLDDTYRFADRGRSGFHGDHLGPKGDLMRFLNMVRAGTITPGSVLIIENLDRLSRQEVDLAYDVFRELIKRGIWIATKTPRRIYRKENNSFMDLMEPIWLFYLAHMESLKKSERIGAKWQERRKQARVGKANHGRRCLAWLELVNGTYHPIASRVRTIRTIFRLAKEGTGIHRIVTWLNHHPAEHPAFGRSGVWLRPYVRKILRSRAVLGEYQPRRGRGGRKMKIEGEPILNYYPTVIEEDEWRLAQAAIDGRRRRSGRPGAREANLFTGIVFEATSSLPMSIDGRSSGIPGKVYRYLVAYQQGVSCRVGKGIPYGQFEDGILRRIGQLKLGDVLPAAVAVDARETRIADLNSQLVALDHRMTERGRELDTEENADVRKQLKESIRRLGEQKAELIKEQQALKLLSITGRGEALTEAQSIIDMLRDAELERPGEVCELRRRLKASLRWLVEEIWLLVQPMSGRTYVGHAQIYLRNGQRRYVQLLPEPRLPGGRVRLPKGVAIWDLENADFRAGDVGDIAHDAQRRPELVG